MCVWVRPFRRWICYGLGWNLSYGRTQLRIVQGTLNTVKYRRYSWSYRSALSATAKLWSRLSTWQCKMSLGSCSSKLSEPESHPCSSLAGIITGSVTNWNLWDELGRHVHHRQIHWKHYRNCVMHVCMSGTTSHKPLSNDWLILCAKGNMSFCQHLLSIVCRLSSVYFSHFNLLLWKPSAKWTETW